MTRPDSVRIRRPQLSDAEALAHLQLDVWEDAYTGLMSPEVFEDRREHVADRVAMWKDILGVGEAEGEAAETWVAEDSDRLVGFVSVGPARDDDLGQDPTQTEELYALYVRASSWDTGLGYALLCTAVADRAGYLWVLAANTRAVRFYERQGFVLDGAAKEAEVGRHVRMVRS